MINCMSIAIFVVFAMALAPAAAVSNAKPQAHAGNSNSSASVTVSAGAYLGATFPLDAICAVFVKEAQQQLGASAKLVGTQCNTWFVLFD